MRNGFMNFGLCFETCLGLFFCYVPIFVPIGMRPLNVRHFGIPALPFFAIIMTYDEIRKWILRTYSANKSGWADPKRPGDGWF